MDKGETRPISTAEDEASLLAAIGSTLQESNNYETQVLREATLSDAPQLSGVGFPALAALAPSYSANDPSKASNKRRKTNGTSQSQIERAPPADINHILKVLSNVTSSLEQAGAASESRQAQLLRIKHQMLLTYLSTYTNLSKEEVGINVAKEARTEERRKEHLLRGKEQTRKQSATLVTNYNHKGTVASANSGAGGPHSNRDGAQRLEQIKAGGADEIDVLSRSATASFGKQALANRNASIENAQRKGSAKKMSMMSMKRKLVEDEGETWVDPEELWKKREARLERRRLRAGRRGKEGKGKAKAVNVKTKEQPTAELESGIIDLTESGDSDGIASPGANISIKADDTSERVQHSAQTRQASTRVKPEEPFTGEISQSAPNSSVHCSICNETLSIPEGCHDDVDSLLSKHMQNCQEHGGKRSTRSRRSVTKPVSYKEDEDIDLYQKMSNKQRRRVVYADDEDLGEVESSDDDPIVEGNDEEVEIDAPAKIDYQFTRNKAIDDFNEDDYEDRVDEWIDSGVQNMREMAEKDESDERPGAAMFSGGLEIPAWMNDKLFGYQRTALRWMWELHLQGAGGIVGDEMGLGKTVQVCSYLGAMTASRKTRSILIIAPATILMHWLSELSIWAPGLRRILMHKSGERGESNKRNISTRLLAKLDKWLSYARADRLNEPIDEKDLLENGEDSFCGTGYVVLTTYENIRRCTDIWVAHKWSYIVMDEGQKVSSTRLMRYGYGYILYVYLTLPPSACSLIPPPPRFEIQTPK